MQTFKTPFKLVAEFDSEPIYIEDSTGREVARFSRSDSPTSDLAIARAILAALESAYASTGVPDNARF